MDFNKFLDSKKIDYNSLKDNDIQLYNSLKYEYEHLGKINLDFNKKYLFNELRLLYPLKQA